MVRICRQSNLLLLVILLSATVISCLSPQKNTLRVEGGVVTKSGEVVRLARTTLRLVDKSFSEISRDLNISIFPKDVQSKLESDPLQGFMLSELIISRMRQTEEPYIRSIKFKDEYMKALDKHTVASAKTEFDGKAIFLDVPQGTFYVVAYSISQERVVVWNQKIELKRGTNSLILDQDNGIFFPSTDDKFFWDLILGRQT